MNNFESSSKVHFQNLRNGLQGETAVKLDFLTLKVNDIKAALLEILNNPKYLKNAQTKSRLFRDQPEKPIDRAVFWIEWVTRHKANLLAIQLPIRDLGKFVASSYDVIAFLLLLPLASIGLLHWILVKLCRKLLRQKETIKQKKLN